MFIDIDSDKHVVHTLVYVHFKQSGRIHLYYTH